VRSCTATGEKATVITDWSWWRVSLPIAIFVDFNMVYILV
jgi:hypothetical protein